MDESVARRRRYRILHGLGEYELAGEYRHCIRWKKTRAGWRCAEYAPGPGAPAPTPTSGFGLGATLAPGECRVTKKGVKYCYIPGVGVRFVGKA